jgi:hypothetical protein
MIGAAFEKLVATGGSRLQHGCAGSQLGEKDRLRWFSRAV